MILKLICNDQVHIIRGEIYDNGEKIRDAEMNRDMIDLINSIEIDLSEYIKLKTMALKNKNLSKLVQSLDLKLLI